MARGIKPLISVIVPVYKVEPYLKRCVNSIINQTYANLEIIFVDDGSPDGCPAICDEYAKVDSRVKVIHKANGGLAEARNVGISVATGEYLTFVDSDDFVSLDYVNLLYKGAAEFNADISLATFFHFSKEDECVEAEYAGFALLTKEDIFRRYTSLQTRVSMPFVSACNKLYRKTLFEGVAYPKGKLYEDSFTSYKILDKANQVVMTEMSLYYYFINPSSIMGQSFRIQHLDVLDAFQGLVEYFKLKGITEISRMCYAPLLMREIYCWWGVRYILKDGKVASEILSDYRENCKKIFLLKTIGFKWKIVFALFALCPTLYALYRRLSPVYVGGR